MRNNRLLPYDTIVQATSGEPEAVNTVLQYYSRRIRHAALVDGQADKDIEEYIIETLLKALFTIGMLDGTQSVSHSHGGTGFHQFLQGILNQALALGIEG